MSIEKTILSNLIENETYTRRVLAYIDPSYFSEQSEQIIFKLISRYVNKYSRLPTKETLNIDLEKIPNLNEVIFKSCSDIVNNLSTTPVDDKWLLETTEEFCKQRSVYNAVMKAIKIYDDKEGKEGSVTSLPSLFTEAVSVSFDQYIGHDYLEQFEDRWEYYNRVDLKVPFEVDMLNKITKGGLSPKTLTVLLAGVHVGKSLTMGSMAAHNLVCGKNVLYITLELGEIEGVSKRIDANLLDVEIGEIEALGKEEYLKRAERLKKKSLGKLIVKEFPTATANILHFKHLLTELKLKKKFIPDIIYVDYLNLMTSSRVKANSGANSYTIIKNIAEELRGLAVEHDIPIVTATQLTRSGSTQADVGMEDTAESFGLPATADVFLALTQTEELKESGQYLFKQLKNRLGDMNYFNRFVVGVDKPRMRLYNVEQGGIVNEKDNNDVKNSSIMSSNKIEKNKFNDFT